MSRVCDVAHWSTNFSSLKFLTSNKTDITSRKKEMKKKQNAHSYRINFLPLSNPGRKTTKRNSVVRKTE